VDRGYDCKRVLAPADLSQDLKERFSGLALRIAQALDLKGIMDVEVILHGGELKVLEIDARLPSQTPAAVLKSTGINMIELLSDIFVRDSLPEALPIGRENSVIYEHVRVTPEKMEISGEHVMTKADGLRVVEDFFGAEEAITDYDGGRKKWVATLIFSGSSSEEVWRRRHSTLEEIKKEMNLTVFDDPVPE
jgi:pyrrolysine biosynthesis protein PylC